MKEIYQVKTRPIALSENQVVGKKYRITILTDCLIRFEYNEQGEFEDRATQTVFYRDFPKVEYRVVEKEEGLEIHTANLHVIYNEKEFTSYGLKIQVKGNLSAYHSVWRYGEGVHDLGGTARTLDMVDGETSLERGIVSYFGYSVLDDSHSQILLDNGWIEPAKKDRKDFYFFGYGRDYKRALKDFYSLCGRTPMLPRYALGNWWSRYYKYTEQSYMALMERFDKENLPFSVAVIDMDWHLVDIDPKYGSGWTGYTWNQELFPEPKRFLKRLHERGMKVTLNVHPADGVRGHEDMYEEMAKAMDVAYEQEDPIICDLADPKFIEAYFQYLHHPREEEGVDFWWIDWQQGSTTKIEGLDPLWILNHFHFLDSKRNGKRPMTFSRYAGVGSHRYPIGFSGDTITTWDSLQFQPYFTATASNIGYGWWSHDIGGHMMGYKDDEMMARWTQFGIYSPIMRLHSSCSEFNGKEPWRFKKETEVVMGEALRQRHKMLPYLYTMNYRNYQEGMPLIMPMYYEYPEKEEAYQVKNQYFFGSEMIVAPITTKRIEGLNVAKVTVWLPEGTWYDLDTGMVYDGDRTLDMYRTLKSIPVLVKAGGILPFTEEISAAQVGKNPDSLHIKIFAGKDGKITLYEDDNETCKYEQGICAMTTMEYRENDGRSFKITSVQGEQCLIPKQRSYMIELYGYEIGEEEVRVKVGEDTIVVKATYDKEKRTVLIKLPKIDTNQTIQICLENLIEVQNNQVIERVFHFLNQAEIAFHLKDSLYAMIKKEQLVAATISQLHTMNLDKDLSGAILEILTARLL